jgi:YegS/Rv2252/BmrU family lipid kinase
MFFNASSGAKLPEGELSAFRSVANDLGVQIVEIGPDVDIGATIRRQVSEGRRLFLAAGGDGTIHHVLQPLVNSEATLAVIPVGTYNHFARDVGIPLTWREALETALHGETRQIDVGRANDRFFVNNLSIGLYPELVRKREERGRDYPRWKARMYAAYSTLRRYRHVTLSIDTEHHHEIVRTHVFIVSNNTYDLSRVGIEAPRSTLSEGRLSVYWLPHMPRIALMKFVAHYLAGRVRTAPGFRSFRTQRMKVQSSRLRLHAGIDGEVFTLTSPLVITSVPQSLLVKVPKSA